MESTKIMNMLCTPSSKTPYQMAGSDHTRVWTTYHDHTEHCTVSQYVTFPTVIYAVYSINAMAICIATVMGVALVAGRAPDSEYSSEAMIAKLAEGAWRGSESGVPADFECE